MNIRLGTRGSRLALIQSERVAELLLDAGHDVELVTIVTEGDLRPVDMSPGEGVFVTAIARALLARDVDIAVHSAKDVPLEEETDLVIAAYPERADPRDARVWRNGRHSLQHADAHASRCRTTRLGARRRRDSTATPVGGRAAHRASSLRIVFGAGADPCITVAREARAATSRRNGDDERRW